MKSKKKSKVRFLRALLSVMLGLMCALFAVIASNIIFILWDRLTGIPDAGSAGGILFDAQRLCLFLAFAALAGILSAKNLNKTRNDVLVSGVVAGISMAVFLYLPLVLLARNPGSLYNLIYLSLPPYLLSNNIFDYAGTFWENIRTILAGAWLALSILFLLFAAIASGAAYFTAIDSKGKLQKKAEKPAIILAVLVLLVLLLPTVAAAAAVGAGVMAHPTGINYQSSTVIYGNENATNAAEGNKTLSFELMASPGLRYLDARQPFIILVDGKDASNQSAVAASGLQVTIDPPEGLASTASSTLTVKGILPSSKVEIVANYRDGVRKPVLAS